MLLSQTVIKGSKRVISSLFTSSLYFSETIHAEELNKTTELKLGWETEIDLEAEFLGLLSRIKDIQRKERMTVLQNKPLNLLTEQEKREPQQLANSS